MGLEPKVKEAILESLRGARASAEKGSYSDLMKVGVRLFVLPDLLSDEKWKKEFYLSAFILGAIGSGLDKEELDALDAEKKSVFQKGFLAILQSLYDGIANEEISKIDDAIKEMIVKYYVAFGPL